jgi:transcription elongation factor S-II
VHQPTVAMASKPAQEKRAKLCSDHHESTRSDWDAAHADEIMVDNGIDPSRKGEFNCRKCGRSKTVINPVQTRSADEPATLFITCLTCGHLWKQH